MRKIFALLIVTSALLIGCKKQSKDTSISESIYKDPHYSEVEDLHIEWKDLFLQSQDDYFAYVYSVTCTPCSMLREQVVEFARRSDVNLYFIYPSDDVPFVKDEDLADSSLGATDIKDVYCYSTPTLIEITNKVVTKYSRSYSEIQSFIESYNK